MPKSIPRPEYVGKPTAREGTEPWVQTPEVIEKMRVAGRIAAGALAEAGKVTLHTKTYPLTAAPDALADLDAGRVRGRAILVP